MLDTWSLFIWKDHGKTCIDIRAMRWLCQWLTEQEAIQLVESLSSHRILWLDSLIRQAVNR